MASNEQQPTISASLFGAGFPAQAASLDYQPAPPVYHSRREPGLPHLQHFTDQQEDMLVGLNSYGKDLEKKRAADARANARIGSLLYEDTPK
ncbi:hypothetical protein CHLRE_05g240450v5 [Chlamydomonas reinhardtii]|uniref:Uncharacterized protein n=1 Tax=Chlamydomonas reinhardtii TaxID=3055 RepID=A8J850_CHLRE|nr:uncharacterized protein CHLRE_05g240450v5 [Chlamydomonas reinhardtii]PNW83719.1 hypothetical protein CHLRE_05g240450v5 [Chlamydomonas reinhardtii]|eukprot:XP_001697705.1 predicted protein [Chlamydomonas reinhardtii]